MTRQSCGVIYGKFSGHYARTVKAAGNGDPDYESVIEAGIEFN